MKITMKKLKVLLLLIVIFNSAGAQLANGPKLVVGIVVDQMRWDYLYRYSSRYGNDGFKRLLRDGFSCENTLIPYTPTYTAAGHTCVYTGSVPALHGIMGNNWYNRELNRVVYCTEDNSVKTVGSNSVAGQMSPKNLWANTITDEIRLAQNFRNKTIAVALKDRGAILPGGHTANGAYWFDNFSGGFITSTFYMQQLPEWVSNFNSKKLPDAYLKQNWNTLYSINTYAQSTEDKKTYENIVPGEDNTFPHTTDTIKISKYESFRYLPYANTYTLEMARAAIEGEKLGKNGATDVLTVSLSSTDYMGHAMGPNSVEAEDMYLRLDKDLGAFLKYLDAVEGKGNYVVFLTADHGAAHVPAFVKEHKMPGGFMDDAVIKLELNNGLEKDLGVANVISSVINYQVYLNYSVLTQNKLDKKVIKQRIIDSLLKYSGVANAYDLETLQSASMPAVFKERLSNGYNQKLSGDIQFMFKPQWFDGWGKGTTHGTWNPYDAHIPLIWYGWNIKPGKSNREVYMTDIAPTLGALLHVQMPNASVGKVIEEVIK
jgi:predicted AlkP superfamily pyrophosphatase or phosphodiesterase